MNSPAVQVIVQCIRGELGCQEKTSELYLNQQDIAGRTAVHKAMLTFLRRGEMLIESQKTVDNFNQLGSEKMQAAKKI